MLSKGCGNYRSRIVSRSYSYVGEYSAEIQRCEFCRIFEREKFFDDFDRHANLKYKYGNRHFWCRGYYVDTVGRNKKAIEEYIRNQLQEDIANDQISMKEYIDPFTGGKKK